MSDIDFIFERNDLNTPSADCSACHNNGGGGCGCHKSGHTEVGLFSSKSQQTPEIISLFEAYDPTKPSADCAACHHNGGGGGCGCHKSGRTEVGLFASKSQQTPEIISLFEAYDPTKPSADCAACHNGGGGCGCHKSGRTEDSADNNVSEMIMRPKK